MKGYGLVDIKDAIKIDPAINRLEKMALELSNLMAVEQSNEGPRQE
jgi:hypothetical protein